MALALESHPKRAEVDALLLAGTSTRECVRQLNLALDHKQVWRYKRDVLIPAVLTARKLLQNSHTAGVKTDTTVELAKTTQQVSAAKPILDALKKRLEKRDRWEELAEADSNWPALASFDRNGLADLRTEAELTGALNSGPVEHLHMHILVEPAKADVQDMRSVANLPHPEPILLGPGDVEMIESPTGEVPTE